MPNVKKSPQHFTRALQANSLRPCNTPNCLNHRTGLEGVCSVHLYRHARYGSGTAIAIHRRHWKQERENVAALFAAHEGHEGLKQAIKYVDKLTAQALANEGSYFGAEEMARMHRAGVTSIQIVTEVCAAWMYIQANPFQVVGDRPADFLLSRAVIQLAPRARSKAISKKTGKPYFLSIARPRASALINLGKVLRQALVPLLVNVARHAKAPAEVRKDVEEAMRLPFGIAEAPPAALR